MLPGTAASCEGHARSEVAFGIALGLGCPLELSSARQKTSLVQVPAPGFRAAHAGEGLRLLLARPTAAEALRTQCVTPAPQTSEFTDLSLSA